MKKLMLIAVALVSLGSVASSAAILQVLDPGPIYKESPSRQVNWAQGYNAVYVGTRLPLFDRQTYLERLTVHVNQVKANFGKTGLLGYAVYTDGDHEIAYINWTSEQAMNDTFASPIGKLIMGDAGSFMHQDEFQGVATQDLFKLFPRP